MAATCPNCGFHNPPGMRFCGNCGTRLPEDLSQAGSLRLPATDVSTKPVIAPEQLGVMTGADLLERFRQAGLEASGQRRSVTVLFVDLSGYTHLSEELNDEALYELIQKFIRLLVNDVYKYEGMVDKLTGDGLMALFGAPIAHENNAERALRAALDMMTDVANLSRELNLRGQDLRIHVGLNSGSVIVGGLGGDGLMNYTAIGDSVNLARRLEEHAGPGDIFVSESVYRQTQRLFDFSPRPGLHLKNVSHTVDAYQVMGPKQHPGLARGLEGLHAPMIGRETELCQVLRMVDRLVEERAGGVVLLIGEGGMGKSRLTSELKARLDYTRLRVLEGQSLTYRKSIAYWIFQDLLRSYIGLTADPGPEEAHLRLVNSLEAVLGTAATEKLPYLEHMLSLESTDSAQSAAVADRIRYLDAEQLRQQIFLAVRDWLVAEANQRPLLLILEDLHWADEASLELLRFLIDSTRSAPLLIYAISRPFVAGGIQSIHERAQQRLSDRYCSIQLQALPPDQSAALLQALLVIKDLPETLRTEIIRRSAGLPFYLEEILRMLIDNHVLFMDEGGHWRLAPGADQHVMGVPETLQGLILARFDRLSPLQRQVLQTAAVIGYQFNRAVLQHVLEVQVEGSSQMVNEAITYLVEHEYILSQNNQGEDENDVFKHVLVSDAVYSTLLQRDRRELHTRVGQAVEKIYAGRLEGQVEVLAGHFLRSTLLDRALHYLTLAGEKAARSYTNEQALQYFDQALEIMPQVDCTPEQAVRVYLGKGDGQFVAGDYPAARETYRLGLDVLGARAGTGTLVNPVQMDAERWLERKRLLSLLQRKVARTQESQGDYEEALSCLRTAEALLLGNETQFSIERANIYNDTGWVHFRRGNMEQAESLFQTALHLAEQAGQLDVVASVLNRLAGLYYQRDSLQQAADCLTHSLLLRKQMGDVVAVARSYNNLGLLGWKLGDLTEALENFNHSLPLMEKLGDVEGLIVLHTNIGLIEMDRGNLNEAERHFQRGLDSADQIGHFFHVSYSRMHLALLYVYAENWAAAIQNGLLGLKGFEDLGVTENQLDLFVSLGWAYRGMDDQDRFNEVLQKIFQLIAHSAGSAVGTVEGEGRALRLISRAQWDHGDFLAAEETLNRSAAIFLQSGNQMERCRCLVDLAGLFTSNGKIGQADELLKAARTVFERMGARMELERLEKVARKQ